MSQMMKALKASQHRYQAVSAPDDGNNSPIDSVATRPSMMVISLLILLPASLGVGLGVERHYRQVEADWLLKQTASPSVIERPVEFSVTPWRDEQALAMTYELTLYDAQAVPSYPRSNEAEDSQLMDTPPVYRQPNVQASPQPFIDDLDLSQLSPELALRVQSALKPSSTPTPTSNVSQLAQQGLKWTGQLPALNFQTHVYSSKPDKRWVKVNGVEYQEGDWIATGVQLVSIEPQHCMVSFSGERIEIPALYDWQG